MLVFSSLTKNTMCLTVPNVPNVSTLKKSQAQRVDQCLLRNAAHVFFLIRSGADVQRNRMPKAATHA